MLRSAGLGLPSAGTDADIYRLMSKYTPGTCRHAPGPGAPPFSLVLFLRALGQLWGGDSTPTQLSVPSVVCPKETSASEVAKATGSDSSFGTHSPDRALPASPVTCVNPCVYGQLT